MLVMLPWSCCRAGIKPKGPQWGGQGSYGSSSPQALSALQDRGVLGKQLGQWSLLGAQSSDHSRVEHQLIPSAAAEEMQVRSVKTCNKILRSTGFLRKCAGALKTRWYSFLLIFLCFTRRRRERVQMQPWPLSAAALQTGSASIITFKKMKISTQSQAMISDTTIISNLLICLCLPNNVHKFFPGEIKSCIFLWFSPPEGVLHKSLIILPSSPKCNAPLWKLLRPAGCCGKKIWENEGTESLPKGSTSKFLGWLLFYICAYIDIYTHTYTYIQGLCLDFCA